MNPWIQRTIIVIAMALLGQFDYENNMSSLGSSVGALAFTWSAVALAFTSSNFLLISVSLCCALLSGIYNLDSQMSEHVTQKQISAEIKRNTESLKELQRRLYTTQEIQDCFNDIPKPCKSASLEAHNNIVMTEISKLSGRNHELIAKRDLSWQEPDKIELTRVYGTAFVVPIALSCFAGGLRRTFNLKKSKPPLKLFKPRLNFFKPRLNQNQTNSNPVQPDSKQIERDQILRRSYKQIWETLGEKPKVKQLFESVRYEPGLSAYKYTREWYNNLRPEDEPTINIIKNEVIERPIKIIDASGKFSKGVKPTGPTF